MRIAMGTVELSDTEMRAIAFIEDEANGYDLTGRKASREEARAWFLDYGQVHLSDVVHDYLDWRNHLVEELKY